MSWDRIARPNELPVNRTLIAGLPALVSDEQVRPLDSSFNGKLTRLDVAVGIGALVAACGATAIIVTGDVAAYPAAFAAVVVANVVTLAVAGLLWRHGRPTSSFGTLLLAEGVLVTLASLSGSPVSGIYLAGILAGWAAGLGLTWLLLAYPGPRPRGRAWIVMGTAGAAFLLGEL